MCVFVRAQCVHVCACLCAHNVYMYLYVSMYVRMYTYYVYVVMCMCLYVYMYVCVCNSGPPITCFEERHGSVVKSRAQSLVIGAPHILTMLHQKKLLSGRVPILP